MNDGPRAVSLRHEGSGREVPVEVLTVFGRNDHYYRYTEHDQRPDRLNTDVAEGLAVHNYVQISSDSQISRTHGLLDPALPAVCDLNSTNGVFVNGSALPTRQGREGPQVTLADGDVITLGRQAFRVRVRETSAEERKASAQRLRLGLVASESARAGGAERVQQFLTERKGFQLLTAADWPGVISTCYALQQDAAADGLVVVSLCCRVQGAFLELTGEELPLDKLLAVIQGIPGRKILALEVDGDPTAAEELFETTALEDMVLLTCPPPVDVEERDFHHTGRSQTLDGMRASLSGESVPGAYDELIDGLDALIQADTNILMVSWIAVYEGRVRVSFGSREDADERAISHSLRYGSTTFRF